MVIEHVLLAVISGQEAAFETAMVKAGGIVATVPGFISLSVRPSLEQKGQYLMLIEWESVDAHKEGFRKSTAYQDWKALLHHFYDPIPTVNYYGDTIVSG